jgi:hypothetical protein
MILTQLIKKEIRTVFLLTTAFFAAVFLFGLPLTKSFTTENFKPISELSKQNNNSLYIINNIAPEVIWHYGEKIPQIYKKNGIFNLPAKNEFMVLANKISQKDIYKISKTYSIERLATYDLNESAPHSKQYKDRLITKYYYLKKK